MIELLVLTITIAFLGAIAGNDNYSLSIRRIGIPIIFFLYALYNNFSLLKSSILLFLILIFSMGYGIPDREDEGSFLGKFFNSIANTPSACCRCFIAVLISICFYFLASDKFIWLVLSGFLWAIWFIFGGDDIVKDEGSFFDLLVEDLILYGCLGFYAGCILINK